VQGKEEGKRKRGIVGSRQGQGKEKGKKGKVKGDSGQ
jgi:hypothetical protein